jgi:hypothetical protein
VGKGLPLGFDPVRQTQVGDEEPDYRTGDRECGDPARRRRYSCERGQTRDNQWRCEADAGSGELPKGVLFGGAAQDAEAGPEAAGVHQSGGVTEGESRLAEPRPPTTGYDLLSEGGAAAVQVGEDSGKTWWSRPECSPGHHQTAGNGSTGQGGGEDPHLLSSLRVRRVKRAGSCSMLYRWSSHPAPKNTAATTASQAWPAGWS